MPQGRLTSSGRSDNSEMDIDGTESEIARLQRQFRIMEGDRQAYNLQAREQIRKQQQEIEKLLKEQEELNRNLNVCKSSTRLQQDSEDTQRLQLLLKQKDDLEEDLEKERQCHKEMQKQKKTGSRDSDSPKSDDRQTQKAVQTLEYKLDRSLTRFNEQLAKNSHVREELQTLHHERLRFQQLHNKLNKELQEHRKKIGEMINLSTAAYDARVEAQSKMTMMREKAVKDLAQYNAEMKELERIIAHEHNLKEFMTTKCSERSGQDNTQEEGPMSELREQRRMDSGEESLDALEEVFERIQTVTGEDNLDLLVSRFIQVEDRNFALFNFVNEQNNEAEALRDQISQVSGCFSFNLILIYFIYSKSFTVHRIQLDLMNNTVSKLECDRSVIGDTLISSTGITDNNIMSYLSLVEQKINELLTIQAFLKSKDAEKDYNPKDLAKSLLGQNLDIPQPNDGFQPGLKRFL
uniref:Coiled-coil domain-containing protein 114-like n=1 Tax=Gouania willdenowi TaxID=441366 RepID=A0A8C5HK38_GOUWI